VSVLSRAGVGEMSDYLVNRTERGRPGSAPTRLSVSLLGKRGRAAKVSWGPPDTPNAPIDFYEVFYAYEDFMGGQKDDTLIEEGMNTQLSSLEPYTDYHVHVRACTRIPELKEPVCGKDWANASFHTGIGGKFSLLLFNIPLCLHGIISFLDLKLTQLE